MPRPPRLIPVDPLVEATIIGAHHDDNGGEVRGGLLKVVNKCVGWLDSHLSVVVLFPSEVVEMAHGLSSTGRTFMWVVRSETRHAAAAARLRQQGTSRATWTSPHGVIGSDWRAPMQQG
jgi:hypothetical protein